MIGEKEGETVTKVIAVVCLVGCLATTGVVCSEVEEAAIADMIYAEAGDAPLICQLALAAVVFNRVRSQDYPNDVLSVLADRGAFPHYDASAAQKNSRTDEIMRIVRAAEFGFDPSFGATSFSFSAEESGVLHLAAGGMFFYGR